MHCKFCASQGFSQVFILQAAEVGSDAHRLQQLCCSINNKLQHQKEWLASEALWLMQDPTHELLYGSLYLVWLRYFL